MFPINWRCWEPQFGTLNGFNVFKFLKFWNDVSLGPEKKWKMICTRRVTCCYSTVLRLVNMEGVLPTSFCSCVCPFWHHKHTKLELAWHLFLANDEPKRNAKVLARAANTSERSKSILKQSTRPRVWQAVWHRQQQRHFAGTLQEILIPVVYIVSSLHPSDIMSSGLTTVSSIALPCTPRNQQILSSIINGIFCTMQKISTSKSRSLEKLLHILDPDYEIPSTHPVHRRIVP